MTFRTLAPALLLLGLAPLSIAALGPRPDAPRPAAAVDSDLDELVRQEAADAADREVTELWSRALELRDAEQLGDEGELDRALDKLIGKPQELSPHAALLLVAARLQGTKPQMILLANAILPLLDHADEEVAVGAVTLLGDSTFRGLTRSRSELFPALMDGARDTSRTPSVRLRFARTAYEIGGGAEGREARALILEYLDSKDPELRALGALTLARLRGATIEGPLREELERLVRVPDERGALAEAILKRTDEREYLNRKLREQRNLAQEGALPEELEELMAVLHMIENRHLEGGLVEQEDLLEAAVDGMLRYMDVHSSYMPSEVYARFFQDLEAEYGGIGAYVDIDPDDGLFTIQRPIYSGPAYEAGLKTDDKIVRIDEWPTVGQDREDIIKRLKGKPGTPVTLYIWQRGMDFDLVERPTEDMAVRMDRELIEIPAGAWQLLPGGIGLVELTTFSRVAMEELRRSTDQMREDGMRALILDMRRNSGGLLSEAREVASLFLPAGKVVVSTEGRAQEPRALKTRPNRSFIPEDMPVIILTGRFTASAAEIVSGALKDHRRATLVGQTTYGKGSVQQLLPVEGAAEDRWSDENGNERWDTWEPLITDHDGDGEMDYAPRIKLTIARYLLPSGRSIHRELNREGELTQEGGVTPHHEVKPPLIERWRFDEQRRISRSPLLRDYLDAKYDENHELFSRLAVNDQKNPDYYPEFDELMVGLETTLPRDDVRRVLRELVRRRVQDDRGGEFPYGDFVEDNQLQKAIEVALAAFGEKVEDVEEFDLLFDFAETPAEGTDLASLVPPDDSELRRARALILEATERGDTLSEESLRELLDILDGTLARDDD